VIIVTASPNTISCIHLWLSVHISQEKCFDAVPASERLMFRKGQLVPVASRNNNDDRLSHMKTHSCCVFITIALFKQEKTSSSCSVRLQHQMLILKAVTHLGFFPHLF